MSTLEDLYAKAEDELGMDAVWCVDEASPVGTWQILDAEGDALCEVYSGAAAHFICALLNDWVDARWKENL